MNIKKIDLNSKIILTGSALSILSLFMNWVYYGIFDSLSAQNGFQERGYFMLIFLVTPCLQAINKEKTINRYAIIGVAFSIISMILTINNTYRITNYSGRYSAPGMYLMLNSLIIVLIGSVLYNSKTENISEIIEKTINDIRKILKIS